MGHLPHTRVYYFYTLWPHSTEFCGKSVEYFFCVILLTNNGSELLAGVLSLSQQASEEGRRIVHDEAARYGAQPVTTQVAYRPLPTEPD